MEEDRELEETLSEIVEGMGLHLVDMSIGRHRGDVKVNLVLYKNGGIGLDDLTEAQKTIRPRLELEFDRGGLSVEIASPGTARTLKNPGEYRIFAGRDVKLLIGDDWKRGTIESADDETIRLRTGDGMREIAIPDVRKAKLV